MIDGEPRRAVDLGRNVKARRIAADDCPLRSRLERRDPLRLEQRRGRGERPIAEAPARPRIDDLAGHRLDLGRLDTELGRAGPFEQVARHRASPAQRNVVPDRRGRSAGRNQLHRTDEPPSDPVEGPRHLLGPLLERQHEIGINRQRLDRMLHRDPLERNFELLRHQHGEPGVDALAELGMRRRHPDTAILQHLDPGIEPDRLIVLRRHRPQALDIDGRQIAEADREPGHRRARRDGPADQQAPPADPSHWTLPSRRAFRPPDGSPGGFADRCRTGRYW